MNVLTPYTIRFICKNGTEINCKDKFTAMSDKQHSNNTATREKKATWSVKLYIIEQTKKELNLENYIKKM